MQHNNPNIQEFKPISLTPPQCIALNVASLRRCVRKKTAIQLHSQAIQEESKKKVSRNGATTQRKSGIDWDMVIRIASQSDKVGSFGTVGIGFLLRYPVWVRYLVPQVMCLKCLR